MWNLLIDVVFYIMVSVISAHFYVSRLVKARNNYIKKQELELTMGIFILHLPFLLKLDVTMQFVFGVLQIVMELFIVVFMLSGSLVKKLMVYVEMNIILGIGTVAGGGWQLLSDDFEKALFYLASLTVAVILCHLRVLYKVRWERQNSITGEGLTVSLSIVLLCMLYVIAMALYSINTWSQITILYGGFVFVIIMVCVIFWVNELIHKKEELNIKYFVQNTVEKDMEELLIQLENEKIFYQESYEWIMDNLDGMYDNILKTGYDDGDYESNRLLAVNRMLQEKKRLARELGIEMEINEVDYLEKNIRVYDMVGMLANLLDNAIRETKNVDVDMRKIRVVARFKKDEFYVKISNAVEMDKVLVVDDNGELMTTKEDGKNHGLGLKSVTTIAAKYGFKVNKCIEKGEFTVTITG